MIRLLQCLLILTLILAASSCAVVEAVTGFFFGATEAAEATRDAAEQAEATLHTLEHVLLLIPPYVLGEIRRPLWCKLKALNGRRKKRAAA